MSNASGMYQPLLMEHHRNPRNTGSLSNASHQARAHNPLCGDRVDITLLLQGSDLSEVRCETKGCALCRASASLMTLALTGLSLRQVAQLCRNVEAVMTAPCVAEQSGQMTAHSLCLPGDLAVFLPVRSSPSRTGCITLPWQAVITALGSSIDL